MALPLSRIDLNLFRVMDAVFVHGGISGAARHLHLSQPAVSHALARLREALGDPLFVRQGNRMLPTELTRRVTIIDADDKVVSHLGDGTGAANPTADASKFSAPHALTVSSSGLTTPRRGGPLARRSSAMSLEFTGIAAVVG